MNKIYRKLLEYAPRRPSEESIDWLAIMSLAVLLYLIIVNEVMT